MSQLDDTIPQSWRFTCPLAYVLVDGKQIANGEVDLVVKCEAGKSPASASRRAEQPTTRRHRLMVYVPKEAEAKVGSSTNLWPFLARWLGNVLTVTSPSGIAVPGWLSDNCKYSARPGFDAILGPAATSTYQWLVKTGICAPILPDLADMCSLGLISAGSVRSTTSDSARVVIFWMPSQD